MEQNQGQGEMVSSQVFRYSEPTDLITKDGFRGAFWGDVSPSPTDILLVREQAQNVQVFGFQALRAADGIPAAIELHQESVQTELTYPIQGIMDMVIQVEHEHAVVSHMEGAVPPNVNLHEARFQLNADGELIIRAANGVEFVSFPTITPVGSSHGTTPLTDECIYLAVKVIK